MPPRWIALSLILGSAVAWEPAPKLARRHPTPQTSRRDWLQSTLILGSGFVVPTSTAILFPETAAAKDEIFQKNPLTNPILEQVRIWEQAEADEIKYGGELERGDAGNKGPPEVRPAGS